MDITEMMQADDAAFMASFPSVAVMDNDPTVDNVETTTTEDTTETTEEETTTEVEDTESESESGTDEDNSDEESETDGSDVTVTANTEWDNILKTPITINGTNVVFNSPTELVQALKNMSSYQQRFDSTKAQRKLGAALESQGITDSKDVAILIDIFKGNPKALASFIKNKQIDVHSLDIDEDSDYVPNNYQQSDKQERFNTIVDDLNTTDYGKAILIDANNFDEPSVNQLISDPTILTALSAQKQSGVYDKIMTEVTRLKAIGEITPDTPILEAYLHVGTALRDSAKQQVPVTNKAKEDTPANNLKDKVVVKTAKGKTDTVVPNTQAKKAKAVVNSKSTKPQPITNKEIDSLSDEDFLKNFGKLNSI